MNKRIGLVIAGVAAASVLAGGAAYGAVSSIPDSAGVIHGCYDSGGNMKVIDTSVTASCPKGYTSLNWNQTGLAGKNGKDGTNGTSATVNSLGTGDPNCASGGAAITDGTNTAYACTGATGLDGPAGPSTAGTAGLDVTIVTANGTTQAVANCPADHPYLLGGGGSATDSTGNPVAVLASEPSIAGGEGAFLKLGIEPVGWDVIGATGDNVTASAICAK